MLERISYASSLSSNKFLFLSLSITDILNCEYISLANLYWGVSPLPSVKFEGGGIGYGWGFGFLSFFIYY